MFLVNLVLFTLYDYKSTRRFNGVYFVFLTILMMAEVGFLYDYEKYIVPVTFAYLGSQLCFLWLLKPMLGIKIKNFSTHNLPELIIGFVGISFIIVYVLYLIFPLIPSVALFLPSSIAFILIVLLIFGIPFFNKHPDNIMLWGIGGGIIGEMLFGFVYQYISDDRLFIVIAHTFGVFFRILFATYLVRMKSIKETENEYNQIL
ncbi:hypothetical protein [Dokdonia pacifica]|nr:hypothetical protein [Dokdonia pacifica]